MDAKITLYEHKDYNGRSLVLTESCPRLLDVGFQDTASSVVCQKGVWVIYADTHYRGNIFVVHEKDDYNVRFRKKFNDKASSVRLINDYDFTEEPQCIVFQDSNYKGRSLLFSNDVDNLKHYEFNDKLSSIIVTRGAWVGYRDSNFEGEQSLFLKGRHTLSDKPNDQGGFENDSLSSFSKIMVKPSGKLKIKRIDYDSDNKHVLKKPSIIFKWQQPNFTEVEQSVQMTEEHLVQKEDTYEFRWNSTTKVSATLKANINIPFIGKSGLDMTFEESVDVGSTAGEKSLKSQKWIVKIPSRIPPHSIITVSSQLTEGTIDMPFTAFMYYEDNPGNVITEQGIFHGCQYFDFFTEFRETKLPKST